MLKEQKWLQTEKRNKIISPRYKEVQNFPSFLSSATGFLCSSSCPPWIQRETDIRPSYTNAISSDICLSSRDACNQFWKKKLKNVNKKILNFFGHFLPFQLFRKCPHLGLCVSEDSAVQIHNSKTIWQKMISLVLFVIFPNGRRWYLMCSLLFFYSQSFIRPCHLFDNKKNNKQLKQLTRTQHKKWHTINITSQKYSTKPIDLWTIKKGYHWQKTRKWGNVIVWKLSKVIKFPFRCFIPDTSTSYQIWPSLHVWGYH